MVVSERRREIVKGRERNSERERETNSEWEIVVERGSETKTMFTK